ncbi:GNAT family N-acetyltransferase [Roseovarius arcticus]|uniref:GNAT family N-acetyltransferase n=1 Tax=Roseovarius arcticus TaxID=2547404 RepID=UPI001BB1F2EB|nr:GNAT family N-acetyltransferase [Roseovarius arcticus]
MTQNDRHLLEIGLEHLSARAKYFRFLGAHKDLSQKELDKFTATNTPDHVAVGALLTGTDEPQPIGIARFIRLPDQPNIAEIAITISDKYQHLGLGSLLLGVLAKFAQQGGITAFNALVHSENTAMLGLLGHFDCAQTSLGGTEIDVIFPVPTDLDQPAAPAWRENLTS